MLPATDRFVTIHGLHYLELTDGSVRRARGFFDLYDAATQLGLLPSRGGVGETALLMLRGFGVRAPAYLTVIVPAMPGACTSQTYSYLPGWSSVSSKVSPSCMPPDGPEAKSSPGPEVLCTSCGIDSLFVNVIVSPALDAQVLGVELDVLHRDLGAAAATAAAVSAGCSVVLAPPPPPPPSILVVSAAGDETEGEAGEEQREELGHAANSRCSSNAFWACRRFSAWSHAAERSP